MDRKLAVIFQLEDLRVGKHIIRDHRNWKIGELQVEYLWWSLIEPSFDSRAVVAVVRFEDELRALFQPLDKDDGLESVSAVKVIGWRDPMLFAFEGVNIMTQTGDLSLDGISYHLQIKTSDVDANFSFANPGTEALLKIESALIETARHVVQTERNRKGEDYLVIWNRYLKRI